MLLVVTLVSTPLMGEGEWSGVLGPLGLLRPTGSFPRGEIGLPIPLIGDGVWGL